MVSRAGMRCAFVFYKTKAAGHAAISVLNGHRERGMITRNSACGSKLGVVGDPVACRPRVDLAAFKKGVWRFECFRNGPCFLGKG